MKKVETYYCKKCKEFWHISPKPKITKGAFSYNVVQSLRNCPRCGKEIELTKAPLTEEKMDDLLTDAIKIAKGEKE